MAKDIVYICELVADAETSMTIRGKVYIEASEVIGMIKEYGHEMDNAFLDHLQAISKADDPKGVILKELEEAQRPLSKLH